MPPAPPSDQLVSDAYLELRAALLAFLRRHVGDAAAAEDLLHDVVVKALAAGREASHAPANISAWLYTIARHAAVDFQRQRRPTEPLPDDLIATESVEAPAQALAGCLQPLAARLPPIYRDTLVAAELQGQPLQAIADRQGVTLAAVKSRAHRARHLLRQELLTCCDVLLSDRSEVIDFSSRGAPRCSSPCPSTDTGRRTQ